MSNETKKTPFDRIKEKYSPVAYFLLDYKDKNLQWFTERFGKKSLRELDQNEIMLLSSRAERFHREAILEILN